MGYLYWRIFKRDNILKVKIRFVGWWKVPISLFLQPNFGTLHRSAKLNFKHKYLFALFWVFTTTLRRGGPPLSLRREVCCANICFVVLRESNIINAQAFRNFAFCILHFKKTAISQQDSGFLLFLHFCKVAVVNQFYSASLNVLKCLGVRE